MERTLAIIKPDAVQRHLAGKILARLESEGFVILGLKMVYLSKQDAKRFYHVHRDRPFFDSLTTFMSSGPVIPLVLTPCAR
jgi:nucleoside-diphosphate kinase